MMHEFSLAQSIVETVIEVARQNGAAQVLEMNLEMGEVTLVNFEQLNWYIGMLTQGTIAERMRTRVIKVPVQIRCPACGYEGGVRYEEKDPQWHISVPVFECRTCGSPETIITSGREMHIKDINVRFADRAEEKGEEDA